MDVAEEKSLQPVSSLAFDRQLLADSTMFRTVGKYGQQAKRYI
jgi:hypothetical protein